MARRLGNLTATVADEGVATAGPEPPWDLRTRARSVAKRVLDVAISSVVLLLLTPVMVVVGFMVFLAMGRPILLRQWRPGLHGQPFVIFKFRTMTEERDAEGNLLPDEQRLTRFGLFLRHSSLDELPELYNVLRGEMSLVGPRPLLMRYLGRYSPEQMRRHDIRPGITGWTQVNGRNALTWDEKFALDLWYVENQSLGLDFKILLLTLWKALKREGITRPGWATTEEFWGLHARSEDRRHGVELAEDAV
jgi:sugar transferase EpsL